MEIERKNEKVRMEEMQKQINIMRNEIEEKRKALESVMAENEKMHVREEQQHLELK